MSDELARIPSTPADLVIREATAADNDALIALELQTPLLVGEVEEVFDRSPDYFASYRLQKEAKVVLGELHGRVVGVMAGIVHTPMIQGQPRRLVYIHRARVHPDFHHQGVAWAMANSLFKWAGTLGAKGPYYLIAPENERSVAFGGRGGGPWPVELALLEFDTSPPQGRRLGPLGRDRLADAVRLINTTHAGADFFEPLTVESLAARLNRDGQYGIDSLHGVLEDGELVAVAGLVDKGASSERIRVERTGAITRSRGAVVVDWGWAPGRAGAFAELLRSLAVAAGALGRDTLLICEPSPGALPDAGLAYHRATVSLFSPAMPAPSAESIGGLYFDLLFF